jgi:tRNA pseudouridine38-40 synthase
MTHDHEPVRAQPGAGGLRRYRATVRYDGTRYHGWAQQPGLATVEGSLREALARILRTQPVALTCAGRTDTGVHATGQVIHFDAPETPPQRLLRGLNAVLADDIRVASLEPAPASFDARFSALWRHYRYRVTDTVPDPLTRHLVLTVRRPLDVAAMDASAALLVGEHDFGSFCKPRPGATSIRRILAATWIRGAEGVVALDIRADAFCHSMVRSVVGASLEVGAGRRDPGWFGALLASPSRVGAAPVAPPHGLVLVEVGYPAEEGLAARAAEARRVRTAGTPPAV